MFTTASSLSNLNVPQFETRKALIIINLQNDSFYHEGDIFICKNRDFAENIRNLVSIFRNVGDIVWVRTEIAPSTSSTPAYLDTRRDLPEKDSVAPKPEGTSRQRLKDGGDDMESEEYYSPSWPATTMQPKDVQDNSPLSLVESMEMHASAQAMAEKRSTNTSILVDNTNLMEDKPAKIPPGLLPKVYIAGTPGAETLDELKPLVDEERDMTVVKKYYSAFDQTSLLMSLRMRLVTELYICGCLTNIAVYATAADAVQHGFEVNLVEDCLGYRTAAKHEEAIRQMADVFGVNGVDSEEIIAESGGQAPPDTEEPMFVGPGSAGITLGESHPTDDHSSANVPKPPRNKTIEGPSSQPEVKPKVSRRSLELELPTDRGSKGRRARPGESPPTAKIGGLGSGDSRILHDVLISPLKTDAFQLLRGEVKWQVMHHRGGEVPRLVAVQGQIGEEGSIPIYRHPADESPPLLPFSSTVEQIRKEIERAIKQPLNHVLIQLYRDGVDNISEHSDKTLDIVRGSNIINLSLGAQRTMTLRTKKPKRATDSVDPERQRQMRRILMPHNSAFVLGPQTNAEWLHGVRADKRPEKQKAEEERAYKGERISLTFRHIGTFMSTRNKRIWGQGAKGKIKSTAGKISRDDAAQMEDMIIAFGKENHQSDFDWDAEYGQGFDVVNLMEDMKKQSQHEDLTF